MNLVTIDLFLPIPFSLVFFCLFHIYCMCVAFRATKCCIWTEADKSHLRSDNSSIWLQYFSVKSLWRVTEFQSMRTICSCWTNNTYCYWSMSQQKSFLNEFMSQIYLLGSLKIKETRNWNMTSGPWREKKKLQSSVTVADNKRQIHTLQLFIRALWHCVFFCFYREKGLLVLDERDL